MKNFLKFLIAVYKRFISPVLPRACRFYPSCSEYARLAIDVHGARAGVILSLRRLLKCHPYNPGGYDPPPRSSGQASCLPRGMNNE